MNSFDWRYILPYPLVENILYCGNYDREVLKKLERFSKSITFYCMGNGTCPKQKNYDLIIIPDLTSLMFPDIRQYLKHRGYIYWEITRAIALPYSYKTNFLINFVLKTFYQTKYWINSILFQIMQAQKLKSKNIRIVSLSWHKPNFNNCKKIIPLNNPNVFHFILSEKSHLFSEKCKFVIGYCLALLNILQFIVPHISILFQYDD